MEAMVQRIFSQEQGKCGKLTNGSEEVAKSERIHSAHTGKAGNNGKVLKHDRM